MTDAMGRKRRQRRLAWLCAAAATCVLLAPPSQRRTLGDKAAAELAQYEKPVDAAIDRALAFLAKNQKPDGSFSGPGGNGTAVPSLCVMAFLAKGYTPGTGRYGQVINRGIDYILAHQMPNGMLLNRANSYGRMYAHGISTLMLCEVSGMVDPERQKKIDQVLPKALKLTLAAQQVKKSALHQGGWRYQPASADSDISCTGWQLMSLRSARNGGASVPADAIDKAVAYILRLRTPDGGFGYASPSGPGLARTGTALLCLTLCGQHRNKATTGAGDWILKHLPTRFGGGHFYYGMYYASQGMFQLGGDHWKHWAKRMYDLMLKYQATDGSWPASAGNAGRAGVCYATAMSVLAMSVSYRQLPIYQR